MHYEYIVNTNSELKTNINLVTDSFIKENKSYIMEKIFDIIEGKYKDNEQVVYTFNQLVKLLQEQKEVEEFQFFEDSMDNDTTFDNICDIELYKTLFIGKEKKTKKQVISEIFKKS